MEEILPENREEKEVVTTELPTYQIPSESEAGAGISMEELDRKINRWKCELLDTSRNNNMINYHETKRTTLKILEPRAEELFNQLAVSEKTLTFQKPINRETDIRTYSIVSLMETLSYSFPVTKGDIKTEGTIIERENTLKNLKSKAKLAQEEQGTNILYLCFGFIYWKEYNDENSEWVKSPLLMMPVTLGLKSLKAPYTLSKGDDEIEVNPTLDYLFNEQYNIDLPTFELKNENSFREYFATIEEIVDRQGWKVVPEVSLGLLSFLKISMYHDLNDNRELLIKNPILRAIAGDKDALGELPVTAEQYDLDRSNPEDWHEVMNADSSQEEAILLSKMGVSFVMQGPPGTGKSQTITNIIAEALADGKKVLFVSEKAAALQVVLKRLQEVGLDDFCLALHSSKANKKEIVDSIGANLYLHQEYLDDSVQRKLTELFHDRQYLNRYVDELHQPIAPLDESIYTAFSKLAKLKSAADVPFSLEKTMEISKEKYAFLVYCVGAFEKALDAIGGPLSKNPWCGTRAVSAGQNYKQELINGTGDLGEELKRLDQMACGMDESFGFTFDHTWNGISAGAEEIGHFLEIPLFAVDWMNAEKRAEVKKAILYETQEQRIYDTECDSFRDVYSETILDKDVDLWLEKANAAYDELRELGFEHCLETEIGSAAIRGKEEAESISEQLEMFTEQYRWANGFVGIEENDSFANAGILYAIFSELENFTGVICDEWFEESTWKSAEAQAIQACEHAETQRCAETAVHEKWLDSIYEMEADQISDCFREGQLLCDLQNEEATELLKEEIDRAESLIIQFEEMLMIQEKAYALLRCSGADSIEGLGRLRDILELAANALYMKEDWFDARKNAENRFAVEEAERVKESIDEKTEAVLTEWESSVLSIDAEGMLARFKTEYVGLFRKMKAGYKEDIKILRLHSKQIGKSFEEEQIIDILQKVKVIQDELKWYDEHEVQLRTVLGSQYKGIDTDWDAVKHSMQLALQITDKFPYGIMSAETIQAVISITESMQLTGEAKRLADEMSAVKIEKCAADLRSIGVSEEFAEADSLKTKVLPWLNEFVNKSKKQVECVEQLKSRKKDSSLTYQEISEAVKNLSTVKETQNWFQENKAQNQKLFGERNVNEKMDWNAVLKGIRLVKRIKELFGSVAVPQKTVGFICSSDSWRKGSMERISMLSPGRIERLQNDIRKILSQLTCEDVSAERVLLDRLRKYAAAGKELETIAAAANEYSIRENVSIELHCTKLAAVAQAEKHRLEILARKDRNAALLGRWFSGIGTDWKAAAEILEKVELFSQTDRTAVTDESVKRICENQEQRDVLKMQWLDLNKQIAEVKPKLEYFQSQFVEENSECLLPGPNFASEKLSTSAERYESCLNSFGELSKWLDYVETRAECDRNGLADFTELIVAADNTVQDVCAAFERGFYDQWLKLALEKVPAVESFRRRVHEQRMDRFISTDEEQFAFSRKRIRECIISKFSSVNEVSNGRELQALRHEMGKKYKIIPLRKLFEAIPNVLLTLKPCLMMSPLSVAYFLKAGLYKFDMVIFDEASQIFPQDAIGAISRAKQVIITGDTKQLPPTSFFASNGRGTADFDEDANQNEEVYESILEEAASVLPSKTLLWHYRSKHEHLIAFSNKEIYKNELVTFPSSNEKEKDTGVEFVYVEDGYYESGGRNCNIPEAKRCVELVKAHIDKHPERSLGIIAFSEKQQNAILREIQRFREKYPEYEKFFAEGKEDEFFVKNLENVQGDERDTIFFSIGYAKTKQQKESGKPMSMYFGPLGIRGGERRLNVAITRARRNIKLVSSILPSDIDLSGTESEGIRMLRSYIEFAMNGDVALGAGRFAVKPDEFVNVIADFLREKGYKVCQHVGCSDYKIDIAVEHPSDSVLQYAAGIECDGFSYVSARTARDRDRLRGSILKKMGWNMYRIWSAEWYKNPETEGEKLTAFIDAAIEECSKKIESAEGERQETERQKAEQQELEGQKEEKLEIEQQKLEAPKEEKLEISTEQEVISFHEDSEQKGEKNSECGQMEILLKPDEKEEEKHHRSRTAAAEQTEAKRTEAKRTEARRTEVKRTEARRTEAKRTEARRTEAKRMEARQNPAQSAEDKTKAAEGDTIKKSASKRPSELIRSLKKQGFTCIDNRTTSGILWVLYSAEKKEVFAALIEECRVSCKLEKRGAIATQNKSAWRIMFES